MCVVEFICASTAAPFDCLIVIIAKQSRIEQPRNQATSLAIGASTVRLKECVVTSFLYQQSLSIRSIVNYG